MRRSFKRATTQPEQPEKVYIQHKIPNHEHGVRKERKIFVKHIAGRSVSIKVHLRCDPGKRRKRKKQTVAGDPAMLWESTEKRTLNEEFAD
jgi:hypothetical protein